MNENLAAALVAAQAEMPAVEPDTVNPFFKTKYVSLSYLIKQTRPVLNKHGLAMVQLPATNDQGLPVLRTTLWHTSGESLTADAPLILNKNDMQSLGGAVTYARRQAWAAALGISGQDDDDGDDGDDGESGAVRGRDAAAQPEPAPVPRPPTATNGGIEKNQHAQIAILVKELEGVAPLPPEYTAAGADTWIDVLRMRLQDTHKVKSRTELTKKQADELIKWLKDQQIPF